MRIVPADLRELQCGDLVAYMDAGGQIITHRVVRVKGAALVTKGDNRDHNDPSVPFRQVLGKVEM